MKSEKTKLGPLEIQMLAYAQFRNKEKIRMGEVSSSQGISLTQERKLLSRMSKSGLIIRLKRGVYLVPSRIPPGGRWAVSNFFILSKLMEEYEAKYQISGPNAFNFYGYEDQIPNRVYVYNNRIFGEKNIGGFEFVFIKTYGKMLGAAEELKAKDGTVVVMASRARALMDAVYDWSRYNTLPRAYKWIACTVKKNPDFAKELTSVTSRYGNKATCRRIGYLLVLCGIEEPQLYQLKRKLGSSQSLIPWIPGKKIRGSINKDWGLIINGVIPE
jgi:predicted transcriptional regulator of viral defense system